MKDNSYGINRVARRAFAGFTLVEMLLVLVILAALASIVYPNMTRHAADSRIKATRVQIASFRTALGTYEIENGFFPKGPNGLGDLVQQPGDAPNWRGPYIDKVPKDQWGHDFIYVCPGSHNPASYDLMSMGPDGQAGTEDDITNWE